MIEGKFRLPRAALAVLMLGAVACGGDDNGDSGGGGGSTASKGVDTSTARFEKTVKAYCAWALKCEFEMSAESCESEILADLQARVDEVSAACADATADLSDCVSQEDPACDVDPSKSGLCKAQVAAYDKVCPAASEEE